MQIKHEEIEKLLEIVPNYPKVNIFHFNNNSHETSEVLYNFCQEKDYDYDLVSSNDDFLKTIEIFKAQKLDIKRPRYNKQSKLYDFIFITIDFSDIEDKELFFKKIYLMSKNSAKILIFLEHHNYEHEDLLERLNFVALNYIDISEKYTILSVQKMHGWGIYDIQ